MVKAVNRALGLPETVGDLSGREPDHVPEDDDLALIGGQRRQRSADGLRVI